MKHNFLKRLCFAAVCLFAVTIQAQNLESLHVQDGGRVKPFDTFARESLQLIYGKTSFNGKTAVDVVMTWMLAPEPWEDIQIFELRHSGLRKALHFPQERFLFTPKELLTNDRVGLVISELRSERERGNKLNPYFSAVARLENQLSLFMLIKSGEALRFVPTPSGSWLSLAQLSGELKDAFVRLGRLYAHSLDGGEKEKTELLKSVKEFEELARGQNVAAYGSDSAIQMEVQFNRLHPFRIAWICYLLALLTMGLSLLFVQRFWTNLGWGFVGLGLSFHLCGIVVRCLINQRPPVANMYETVIWVPLGVLIISLVLAIIYHFRAAVAASCAVAVLCLILADSAPVILDSSLQPLEPVLRSNFWLSTHVLIITLSYAAFFLAFALGDVLLFYFVRDEKYFARSIQVCSQALYRAIQVGVVLLALGIILGGIWADYSWGRFWGWDPKETWALIALLGYVALLHARLVGLVRNLGMAVGSVIAFSLVIMAWYGVNFVLGAGLHSYGFGAGGIEYVSGFVVLHLIYVVYVTVVYRLEHLASKK